ncbi:hypothetical protein [Vibrio phage phiKT1028]|nr:hypothetical protein [Vibrio phage phiKT1028]
MFKNQKSKIWITGLIIVCLFQFALFLLPSEHSAEGEIINIVEYNHKTTKISFPTVGEPEFITPEERTFIRYRLDVLIGNVVVECILRTDEYGLLGTSNYVTMTYEFMDNGEYRCVNLKPVMED